VVNFSARQILFFVLRCSVTTCLLVFLCIKVDLNSLLAAIKKLQPDTLIILVSLNVVALLLYCIQYIALKQSSSFLFSLKITLIGSFFSTAIPTQLMGDVSKAYKFGKENSDFYSSSAAVLLAKLGYFTSVVLFSLIGLFCSRFSGKLPFIFFFVSVLIGIYFLFLLIFNAKINSLITKGAGNLLWKFKVKEEHINKLSKIITQCRSKFNFEDILGNFILSSAVCTIGFIMTFLVIKDLGYLVSLSDLFWVSGISAVISVLPLSLGGLGLTQLTTVNLLGFLNIPLEPSFASTLISAALGLFFALFGGMLELIDTITRRSL
jgi:uncharacterized protein (TIRG00374 family)